MTTIENSRGRVLLWILAATLWTAAIAVGAYAYIRANTERLSASAYAQLTAVARLKASEVEDWRADHFREPNSRTRGVYLSAVLARYVKYPTRQEAERIRQRFATFSTYFDYDDAILITAEGRLIGRYHPGKLRPEEVALAAQSVKDGHPHLSELYVGGPLNTVHLAVSMPIFEGTPGRSRVVATIVNTTDAQKGLFGLLKEWPVPSPSGESFLVRRVGDRVLALTDLRYRPGSALNFSRSIKDTFRPAVHAVLAAGVPAVGLDYRGREVLTTSLPIQGSNWVVVVKIDTDEAFGPVRRWQNALVLLLLLVGIVGTGAPYVVWQAYQKRELANKLDSERAKNAIVRRYERLIRDASEPFALLTLDLKVIEANQKALDQYGYSAEEVGSLYAKDLIAESDLVAYESRIASLLKEGSYRGEGRHRRKDGSEFPVEVSGSIVDDGSGNILQIIVRDVSERKRIEAELQRRTADAQELAISAEAANVAKSLFLANMSHEIRTPMNAVIGMSSLLDGTPLTADQHYYLQVIQSSGQDLLAIINNILDYSKIEAGKVELESVEFDLPEAICIAADMIAIPCAEKRLRLVCVIDRDVPDIVVGDPMRLRQVLGNLLVNSAKFTESGSVSLHVSNGQSSGRIRFEVEDTGVGIPANRVEWLFKPFTQMDSSSTRRFGGTGLGLAISYDLTSLMGGEIGVAPRSEGGTRFWFELPLPVIPFQSSNGGDKRPRVLVVEHDPTVRKSIVEAVFGAGAEAIEVETIELALARLDGGEKFAAVLAEGTPTQAAVNPGSVPWYRMVSPIDDFRGPESAHLTLPLRRSAVRALLSRSSEAQTAAPKPVESEDPGRPLSVLIVEDNLTNQLVARRLLESLGHSGTVVNNGLEALESLSRTSFDVVLMDCLMPVMDGYEATRAIRKGEHGVLDPKVPIIALTAKALIGDEHDCIEAGMNAYLVKPVTAKALANAIRGAL